MGAVRENGSCIRCQEDFGNGDDCNNCGVDRNRIVQRRRRRKINGKRGRNSGTTKTAKTKR